MSALNTTSICPECGTAETAKLQLPVAICCGNCKSVYSVLADQSIENSGLKWNLNNDISLIRLFTKGIFKGKSFEIIGRVRSVNTMAISNEWLMYFGKSEFAWLTESNFSYFVFDAKPIPMTVPDIKSKKAGNIVKVSGKDYFVMEISKQVQFAMQGQIPYEDFNDEEYFKYELKASDNTGYATICIFDKTTVEAFTGNKVKLEELQLTSINEYNDWK